MKDITANKLITSLKRHYFATIFVLGILFVLVLLRIIPFSEGVVSGGVVMERYAIMITIIVIPLALKFFADRLKKIQRPQELSKACATYRGLYFLRLHSIAAVTLMNILLFGFTRNGNFVWLSVVLFIIFLFCKPSIIELTDLTEIPAVEDQMPEEPQSPLGDE
jgi:hypothetical protein